MFVKFHPGETVDRGFEAEYSVSFPRPAISTSQPATTFVLKTANESGERSSKYPVNFFAWNILDYGNLQRSTCNLTH